ncbi:MAG: FAD-binding protein [Slackia piriformis]|uniref:FAD-binding protein n=1 Tax=Slackia piriformis TaxID=626934 RepID=A0A943UZ99_9ACTN|nr:FAD-binding protein [Slackia piriformis]
MLDGPKTKEIRAESVVLATGGFGGSRGYLAELVPSVESVNFQYLGNTLNTGDGISMAKAVGAACYEDGWVIPFNVMPAKKLTDANTDFKRLCDMPISGAPIEGGDVKTKLLVDAAGERFVNEAAPAIAQATAMADRDTAPYYVLFDSSNADIRAMLDEAAGSMAIIKEDSIEALAEAANTPALAASFEAYRAAAAAGFDDAFGKPADAFAAYQESGPYYLVSYVPSYVATVGGVKTDTDCRVIDEGGNTIEGLSPLAKSPIVSCTTAASYATARTRAL